MLSQPALDAASCEKPHPIERHAKSFSNKTDEVSECQREKKAYVP